MTCSNCANGVKKQLEKIGLEVFNVDYATGEASFKDKPSIDIDAIKKSIASIGYRVVENEFIPDRGMPRIEKLFYFTLIFTIPLFAHMFFSKESLINNVWVQLTLCLPVLYVGITHFGKSAWQSLKIGVPNMDVLIILGILSSFVYSLYGTMSYLGTAELHKYLFYETTATITTLVLLGNVLEKRAVNQTTTAIKELTALGKVTANKVLANGKIELIEHDQVKVGDILQFNMGDKILADGIVIKGDAILNEAMISGESDPIRKLKNDYVIGGTIVEDGAVTVEVQKVGEETVLSQIIKLVKRAQQDKPNIQRLGDKVSAIFVPAVVLVSVITFILAFFIFGIELQQAIMQSVAVLVISCPCAMGLATPTAVMAGIGRAAKNGILIKGGNALEQFSKINNIVFDKTGTITTGKFNIKSITRYEQTTDQEIKNIVFSIEHYSAHPIAKSIVKQLQPTSEMVELKAVTEQKGLGMMVTDMENNTYRLGSYKILPNSIKPVSHSIYLLKNDELIAGIDIEDHIKDSAFRTINLFNNERIKTFLLSGDKKEKCEKVGKQINMKVVYAEHMPDQKVERISQIQEHGLTAMVGDGINDAPALTKADIGISLGNATQIAVQSAQIVLLNEGNLTKIHDTYLISKHTLTTIKQNLFWAFFYNVLAIPIAAVGLLNPMIAALAMALSDVMVVGNSIRLKYKKLT